MNVQYISNRIKVSGRVLMLGAFLGMSGVALAQQTQALKGRIVDSKGEPIVGAVVNVAEDSRIALTDKDGYFTLKKVSKSDEICVSCVGYKNAQEKISSFDGSYKITLEDDVNEFDKEAPTPFGSRARKLLTDARSEVTGEELQKHPVTILQNAFTSTVNGMSTYEWCSEPGWSETAMYIRGLRTMNTSARSPLIIVDNVERDLSFLDAFPIESITILKDAAASSIYGMRGANGVIMVTTKRGEAGKTKIDFTQEIGWNTLSNTMENQNSYNMALTRNRVKYLDGQEPMYTQEQIEKYRRVCAGEELEGVDKYKYFNTNWFEKLYRDAAPQYRTNLQISGGNKTARYYVSFSYLRQEGMWNEEGTKMSGEYDTQHVLNRWNLRSNVDIDVTKHLNVSLDLGGRIDNISQPRTGVFNIVTFGAVEASPMMPVYNPDGSLYSSDLCYNALHYLGASGFDRNRRRNLYSTLNINGDLSPLLKGLKVYATVSFDAYETFQSVQTADINTWNYDFNNDAVTDVSQFTYTRYSTATALSNPSASQREYYFNLNLIGGLQYSNTFGKHAVDAKVFGRAYRNEWSGSESSNRFLSINGQAAYTYNNRYTASFNFSRMGCDNFDPDNRWDNFWGASAAWVASEENFLKNLNTFDLLKLRVSYGRAGQSSIGSGRYPYQSTFASGTGYGFGYSGSYINGYYESMAGNANNKWEVSKMVNVGLDWSIKNRLLYGSFDAFKEWRSDILVTRSSIPDLIGVNVQQDSYGKVESWGGELSLGHENKIGDFKYSISTQWSYSTNKITEMDEVDPNVEWQRKTGKRIYDANSSVKALYESSFNNNVGGWYVYKFVQWASDPNLVATSQQDAIDHPEKYPYNTASNGNQQLGTAVFQDINGDRQIDSKDMVADTYNIVPEWVGNISVGFEWKGFDARAIFTAYLNRSVFLSPAISYSGWSNMGTHEVQYSWGYYTDDPTDPRNVNAKYPRPTYGGFNNIDSNRDTETYQNDIWIQNGNYWSLRNIEVGYSLPKSWISKLSMTKCRIYFNAYNLCTWSHLPDGVDPEKPMSYCWWYPKTRTYTFGINIGF